MLVLSRKNGGNIQIHTPDKHVIHITITEIRKGQVKIGVDAPAYYAILREEVLSSKDTS